MWPIFLLLDIKITEEKKLKNPLNFIWKLSFWQIKNYIFLILLVTFIVFGGFDIAIAFSSGKLFLLLHFHLIFYFSTNSFHPINCISLFSNLNIELLSFFYSKKRRLIEMVFPHFPYFLFCFGYKASNYNIPKWNYLRVCVCGKYKYRERVALLSSLYISYSSTLVF